MPHFIVHCSDDILQSVSEAKINSEVHCIARDSNLFQENDIKVRVLPFSTYIVGNEKHSFIHVFASIMQGRSEEQRAELSKSIVAMLCTLFPNVEYIAMNVDEFEKNTYCNKSMLC